jgi:GT2 family glycosyltransferase
MIPALAIVIPTWNGLELLRRFLPEVAAEAARWNAATGAACEIVVSDDGSTDGTAAWLTEAHPGVRVTRSERNAGFAHAANAGVYAAASPIVILLNNDATLAPGALDAVPGAFADPDVFGVTFRGLDLPSGEFGTGGKLGRFRRGFWSVWDNYDAPAPGPTFMLAGGFCAFRRAAFMDMGGFDPVFAPYYWEDVDLSYRARKRGWKLLYEPRAEAHHQTGSVSTRRHRRAFARAAIIERNRLLFHWRNLGRAGLTRHLFWSHLMLAQMALRGDFAYHAGYAQALMRLPEVARFRRRERPAWRAADGDLAVSAPERC